MPAPLAGYVAHTFTVCTSAHLLQVTPRVNSHTTPDADEVDASRRLLEERIALYGMEEREVKGDGNWYARRRYKALVFTCDTVSFERWPTNSLARTTRTPPFARLS